MKPRINLMIWNIRKKKIFNHNRKENKDYQNKQTKNEDRLRSLWNFFKCTNMQIIGMPEGEEEELEIETLFEKIMKENFPNLVKEIDMQVQEAQSSKQYECRGPHHDIS